MSVRGTREISQDCAGFRAGVRVSIALDDGKVHALVGPNGAGKTTLFHMRTGFVRPSAGSIVAFGADVTGLAPFRISRMGIARSFQITSLFDRCTVLENVILALHVADPVNLRFWESERAVARYRDRASAILEEVALAAVGGRPAGRLPYGPHRPPGHQPPLPARPPPALLHGASPG